MPRSRGATVKAEPNLTPLLDMVFQLITFFMLVTSFKAAELDRHVKLPVFGSLKPSHSKNPHLLVLNLKSAGGKTVMTFAGRTISDDKIADFIAGEAESARMAAKLTIDQLHEGGESLPDLVIVRADKNIPFRYVYRVVNACQENGYREFAFKTAVREEE